MNNGNDFIIPVKEELRKVEERIRAQSLGSNPDLTAALEHLLRSGGKRVRPTLTIIVGKMLGADPDRTITMAAAIELLHTATLVHDDLIDGSLLRRGIPTLNARWSPGATVLTGDYLFARAAKLAAETKSIPAIDLFSVTLGIIVNGEITQMFESRLNADKDEYLRRIYAKTASLFETSVKSAALISEASPEVVETVREFGYNLGMAFQIIDDIFDFTSDQLKLGKPVGSDLRNGLITLPSLYFLQDHPLDPDFRVLFTGEILNDERFTALIERIQKSNAISAARAEADSYVDKALNMLNLLPESPEREQLRQLSLFMTNRTD
ncbi:MAG TPA: polyprenyl synthetase family protein [Bellilinea sp.]|nr:polyprenyl synthetase family protein [Bellilinea sp.]